MYSPPIILSWCASRTNVKAKLLLPAVDLPEGVEERAERTEGKGEQKEKVRKEEMAGEGEEAGAVQEGGREGEKGRERKAMKDDASNGKA